MFPYKIYESIFSVLPFVTRECNRHWKRDQELLCVKYSTAVKRINCSLPATRTENVSLLLFTYWSLSCAGRTFCL